jgi:poly(3-hydroxybutyrate) depolymerase
MLYQAVEAQFAALAPLRLAAETLQQFLTHPLSPATYTPAGRAAAAGLELFERATRRYRKPCFGLSGLLIDGAAVAVREEVAVDRPFCRLVHFARDLPPAAVKGGRHDPVVLVVAPMSGHYATLLRGTVAALLPEHEVYVTDWVDARAVPLARGPFGLDDYIDYIIGFLRHLGRDTHVLAVCQPSPPVLAAIALMAAANDPAQPRSMTLMGGPVDTRASPTVVNRLATSRPLDWFEHKVIDLVPQWYAGANRRVYPGFMQLTGFMSMNLDRHVGEHVKLFQHLVEGDGEGAAAHRRFYDEYLSVMDLTAEFYLDTIRTVFQEHALPEGRMTHRGVKVEPRAIAKTALMTVEGEKDDISGVGQTEAAHALCPGIPAAMHHHHLQKGVGHFGIFNGRRWRDEIYPDLRGFIRSNA